MAVKTSGVLELGMWNFVWSYIIYRPTNCLLFFLIWYLTKMMMMMHIFVIMLEKF